MKCVRLDNIKCIISIHIVQFIIEFRVQFYHCNSCNHRGYGRIISVCQYNNVLVTQRSQRQDRLAKFHRMPLLFSCQILTIEILFKITNDGCIQAKLYFNQVRTKHPRRQRESDARVAVYAIIYSYYSQYNISTLCIVENVSEITVVELIYSSIHPLNMTNNF